MKKPNEEKLKALRSALGTTMEARTPEQHRLISNAAYTWLSLVEIFGPWSDKE